MINVVSPFKSQTSKAIDESNTYQKASTSIGFGAGKKFFKFRTPTTVRCAKSFEDVSVQFPSLLKSGVDIRAGKQKVVSKVKSAKNSVTKLFKSGRGSATALAVIANLDNSDVADSLTPVPPLLISPYAESCTPFRASNPIYLTLQSLKATGLPLAFGQNVANRGIEDSTADFCAIGETSPSSSTGQLLVAPAFSSDAASVPLLDVYFTTKEENRTTVVVVNTESKGLVSSASRISWSSSGSEVTVYFSSDSLSVPSTESEVGLVSLETNPAVITSSFATSVDAENGNELLSIIPRRLRRVRGYEDLRHPESIWNHDFVHSDTSESSYCDVSDGVITDVQGDNLEKSLVSLEPGILAPSRQMNKFKKLRAWLITRYRRVSYHSTQKTSAPRVRSTPRQVNTISCNPHILQSVFRPLFRVQSHVSKPSRHQPSPPLPIPVWSCAKITCSSSKAKKRRRTTKQSMRELKARLDLMDIDSWY